MLKDNLVDLLINLEERFGGFADNIPRRKVSPRDPRPAEKISTGGMIGGDRMSSEHHNYAPAYAEHLTAKIRADQPLTLLEFGVLRGTGLAIWSELLPPGSRIIGLDIDLSHFYENRPRLELAGAFKKNPVEVYEYDQLIESGGTKFLGEILGSCLADIVIDDGCHFDDGILLTLLSVWPHLAAEFVYFIEDNARFAGQFKTNYLAAARCDFPRLAMYKYGVMTVIQDADLARWVKKFIGYLPDLENPRSFNEKINWKKLHDRNPLLHMTADKYEVRSYVRAVLGQKHGDALLKPLLWHGADPAAIPFDDLPDSYVVKANHGSGWTIFVRGDEDRGKIINTGQAWLGQRYAPFAKEWCYDDIEPQLVIEELIDNTPDSYKLHVFHGRCQIIQLSSGSIEDRHRLTFTMYDRAWRKIPVRYVHDAADPVPRPAFLDELIAYAEALAHPFDYVRVDFCIGDKIYFEEITHYPNSGHSKIVPLEYDYKWGDLWTITENYWLTDWPERE